MNPLSVVRKLYKAWVSKTPANALLVYRVMGACTLIIAAPAALASLHITVPQVMAPYVSAVVAGATAVVAVVAKLQSEE